MSNMYGYTDYHGPLHTTTSKEQEQNEDDTDDDPTNPLQVGFWMEGDSLAPPCGTSLATIAALLDFGQVGSCDCSDGDGLKQRQPDVLYDFGCGDGRVCLEATHKCYQQHNQSITSIGVEVEEDLVERANKLIQQYQSHITTSDNNITFPRILQQDLRTVLSQLVNRAQAKYTSNAPRTNDNETETCSNINKADDDLPLPTIIVLYLLPEAIAEIQRDLETLLRLLPNKNTCCCCKGGFRILCNTWGLKGLKPTRTTELHESNSAMTTLYLYTNHSLPSSS